MSSIASTSRPPFKRVRYATDSSSYSSFHHPNTKAATPSRSITTTPTPTRRDAEEAAARELERQRQESRQRVLSVWEGLEKRYSRALDEDDIVDLENLTVIQDSGTLKAIRDVPFGSLAAPGPGEAGSESEEDEEDELGAWDDQRHSVQVQTTKPVERWKPSPLTEEDKRDLKEFLRAEQLRREEQGSLDDEERNSVGYTEATEEVTEEEPVYAKRRIQSPQEQHDEESEEEKEEASVSSFRPTPSEERQTASVSADSDSNSGSEESEDEINELTNRLSKTQSRSRTHTPTKTNSRSPIHSNVDSNSEAEHSQRVMEEPTVQTEEEESSGDDLDDSEDQREMESTYIRARTVEPSLSGRRSVSPVKRAIPPSKPQASVKRSISVSPVKLISTVSRYGNPQLSTPPRSKSSVFSTPDDVFRAGSVARSQSDARQQSVAWSFVREVSVVSELERAAEFVRPSPVVLGKRKRVSSPLSTPLPIQRRWEEEDIRPRNLRFADEEDENDSRLRDLRFADEEESGEESPDPLESVIDEEEITPSRNTYRRPIERAPSPLANKGRYSGGRSSLSSRREESVSKREESIQPADLSQLVFHLRKVNEWVKTHHVEDLLEDQDSSPLPSTSRTSINFPFTHVSSNDTTPSKRDPTKPFPHLTPRKTGKKDDREFITPTTHRTIHSLPGSVSSSVRSVRSSSSAMGPPPTPTRLFASSPLKHSGLGSQSSTGRGTPSPSKSSFTYRSGHGRTSSMDESPSERRTFRFVDEEDERPLHRSASRTPLPPTRGMPRVDPSRGHSRASSASPRKERYGAASGSGQRRY